MDILKYLKETILNWRLNTSTGDSSMYIQIQDKDPQQVARLVMWRVSGNMNVWFHSLVSELETPLILREAQDMQEEQEKI